MLPGLAASVVRVRSASTKSALRADEELRRRGEGERGRAARGRDGRRGAGGGVVPRVRGDRAAGGERVRGRRCFAARPSAQSATTCRPSAATNAPPPTSAGRFSAAVAAGSADAPFRSLPSVAYAVPVSVRTAALVAVRPRGVQVKAHVLVRVGARADLRAVGEEEPVEPEEAPICARTITFRM